MDIERIHTPVMLERTVELLTPAIDHDGAVLVDATLGMGGHARALLERFTGLTVIGLDRDLDALAIARERLAPFGDRARFVHTVYDGIGRAIRREGYDEVDGVLMDLGVSSLQLDRAERGFAYSKDAPLDMRMDSSRGRTAADVIAEASEDDLRRIFLDYGEEKLAARYARAIVRARADHPITRSAELVAIITDATPVAVQRQGHPAKRVFQALRIEVNEELSVLERAVPAALDALQVGGRIVVLAYQSLEDRIVKRAFQAASTSTAPAGLPMELPEHRPRFKLLVRGAELASEAEQAENPRAKPVRLRAAERVRRPS
ncbi:16S rRNA (cytosine(1402)-N(4))-methyltransferase RsmH [Agromyces intestinalis]|uniref:Ribosomal RNA small subunit methyltransferase H n=1 Tax=Agromyces intestinalis TaxID=2592652 RepID=A0A5C1YB64_9MICO|nr:16S rRNA (cytosine(1402)-N(4))-methyltransferase RsmH [Agromyces intestinalis]QEO13196.1 16S rRNA (cytosine(1402)-N(4))-methyltransferase RsmH [Agromyces intestinalis]